MNNNLFKVVRRVLNPLWIKASLRGSTSWGPKKKNNPYGGINLVMVVGEEAVIVSEGQQGRPITHGFREASDTILEKRVGEILTRAGLPFIKTKPQSFKTPETLAQEVIMSGANGMWWCPRCKRGDKIDFISDSDHQSALRKAYQQHEEISPDCDSAKVKIYQMIDNRLTELTDLALIAGAKRPR